MISREHLKRPISQGHCVYLTTFVATIHYNKQSVADSKKFERYDYLRKAIVALRLLYFFHRTSYSNICLKSTVLNSRNYLQPPHSLLANVFLISQFI